MTRLAWRIRLLATCSVFAALAFLQSPGLTAADTKLDLTQNPGGFLLRSLHLWDDQAFFGQLQNQAYGYLFPVGPFFLLGDAVQFPAWALQRIWWWLILCAAFLGTVRLARLMGLESPAARWVAGLVFALSPRVMTTMGPISVETLAYALTPWVLVPLAGLRPGGSVRRAAALSGVAILFMGGVNAVATVVAAAVGFVWIVTEAPSVIRLRLSLWWVASAALASLWFLGPLLLLGRYSPPFLDWIESSSVTTSITDGSAALRGVTDWVAYVGGRGGPVWPAGWTLVSERALVLATVVVATVGVAGLCLPRVRQRRFLVALMLVGLVAIVAPHVSAAGPWADGVAAPWLRTILDGALAPMRNVHKFDAWIRLPIALGVGWSVSALLAANRGRAQVAMRVASPDDWWPGWRPLAPWVALAAVTAGVVGSAAPALRGELTTGRTFTSIPGYWLETSGWLAAARADGRALVVPGASFGSYLWGESRDEPLQPFASTPWAVRDAVPLSSAGNIRALDAVEAALSDGRGDPGLAAYLARMGVSYLVVRNDLDYSAVDSPRPSHVHQALAQSGGFAALAAFGPLLRGFSDSDLVADGGIDGAYPAVEIFGVRAAVADPRIVTRDASTIEVVPGESEGLLALIDGGLGERPAVRTGDLPAGVNAARTTLTDSGRRWEIDFGRVHDHSSSTLAADDDWTLPRRVHDYDVSPAITGPTVSFPGGVTVSASSSRGDAASLALLAANGSWNAVDGDRSTAWLPRGSTSIGQWWQLDAGRSADSVGSWFAPATSPEGVQGDVTFTVATESATRQVVVRLPAQRVALPEDLGSLRTLRITVSATDLPESTSLGLSEVVVPAVDTSRTLVTGASEVVASGISLATRSGRRTACVVRQPTVCFPPIARLGEEDTGLDRTVTTQGILGDLTVGVSPRGGIALDRLLRPLAPAALASASSTWVPDPSARPQAAVDRDPWTAWVASPLDSAPTLTVRLPRRVAVSWLRITETVGLGASRPLGVTVSVGDRSFPVFSDARGYLRFPRTVTSSIRLTITSTRPVLSYDTRTGERLVLPVGISDLTLGEADSARRVVDRGATVVLPCGFGPSVDVIGSASVATEVRTTVGALLDGLPATATSCNAARLPAGQQRVVVAPSAEFWITDLNWSSPRSPDPRVEPVTVRSWSATDRLVTLPVRSGARTLELGENANDGWDAWLGDVRLEPVRVDGWRQAWIVPAGAGGDVRLEFAPDRLFRAALLAGGAGVVALVALAAWPARRRVWWEPSPRTVMRTALRLCFTLVGALVAVGPIGALCAVVVVGLAGVTRRRVALGSAGVLLATSGALIGPWPASTGWTIGAQVVAAVCVAAGTGCVIGALLAQGAGASTSPWAEHE